MAKICAGTVSDALSDIKSNLDYLKNQVNDEEYDVDLINSVIGDIENSIDNATYEFDNYNSQVNDIATELEDLFNTATNLNR